MTLCGRCGGSGRGGSTPEPCAPCDTASSVLPTDSLGTETTCGEYGWCGLGPVEVTSSTTQDEALRAEEPALVCSDKPQAAKSAVSAES